MVLVGHSMGGAVILEAARLLPGQVDGIVIVDTFESFDTWWTPEELKDHIQSREVLTLAP